MPSRNFFQRVWAALKDSVQQFGQQELLLRSAALSYYTIFSLPPILLLLMRIASIFYDPATIERTIFRQFREVFGPSTADELSETVSSIGLFDQEGWALLVGIVGTLFTATTIFVTIQASLNKIFHAEKYVERMGWWQLVKGRLIAIALLLSIAFVLIVTLMINALLARFIERLELLIPWFSEVFVFVISLSLPLLVVGFLFALLFKYLPDRPVSWHDALVGSAATTPLFFVGEYGITFYLGIAQPGNLYDAAGSLVLIMVWIFYASAIFYFGAQFTYSFRLDRQRKVLAESE